MEIETRKVQITGGSTYVISLPKKWINKVKIKSGDGIAFNPSIRWNIVNKSQTE